MKKELEMMTMTQKKKLNDKLNILEIFATKYNEDQSTDGNFYVKF